MHVLNSEEAAVVARARELADEVLAPHAASVDSEGRFPVEAMAALAADGFYGLTIPAEFGGMGQGLGVMAAVLDELAQRCASTAMIYMMHLSGVQCLLAEPEKMGGYLREAAEGRHLTTLAFSESGSRSQFWAPVSRLAAAADGVVTLSARKSWVTSAGMADSIVASAGSLDGTGASVLLVLQNDEGLAIAGGWDSLGMRGNQSNPMSLQSVELPLAERLIGGEGQGADIMLGRALPVFLICQGAIGTGLAEAAFGAARRHIMGHGFEHTGSGLRDLPNLRASLAEMRMETDRARAYLVAVLAKAGAGDPDAMRLLLGLKAVAGETAVRVSDLAMRACGGAAFSKHLGLERVFRDSRANIVMAPTTDHLREFVGRILVDLPLFG